MNESVLVLISGNPQGKGRPRVGKRGKHVVMFTPKETVEYEARIAAEAALSMQQACLEIIRGPVELKLEIFMPIPASYSKGKATRCRAGQVVPTKKPDIDNIIKAVCDAFNGVVWVDDTQVTDLVVSKRFGDEPCVLAIVTALDLESS